MTKYVAKNSTQGVVKLLLFLISLYSPYFMKYTFTHLLIIDKMCRTNHIPIIFTSLYYFCIPVSIPITYVLFKKLKYRYILNFICELITKKLYFCRQYAGWWLSRLSTYLCTIGYRQLFVPILGTYRMGQKDMSKKKTVKWPTVSRIMYRTD